MAGTNAFWDIIESLPLQWGTREHDMPYITLDRTEHSKHLSIISVPPHRLRQPTSPVTEAERAPLRQRLGEQIWVSDQTVPTGCFRVSSVAPKVQSATVSTLLDCNKNVRRLENVPVVHTFGPMSKDICVYSFGDSSKSTPPQRGMATFIGEKMGGSKVVRVSTYRWASKKQVRACISTLAAEALSAEADLHVIFAARRLIQEALNMPKPPFG
eukprot:3935775-Pyramimonas_sp.AAC.1